jgi:hypothetical protein
MGFPLVFPFLYIFVLFFVETRSCCAYQGLKFVILLSQPLELWDYSHEPPHPFHFLISLKSDEIQLCFGHL